MSVIFGIKEENEIIIAGDKRGSTQSGSFVTDDLNKVVTINEQLGLVTAGNSAIEKAIIMDVDKIANREKLTTNDLLEIIKDFYLKANNNEAAVILSMPFCFLLAGRGRDNEASLISGCNTKGRLEFSEVPMALYPPADVDMKECCNIFVKNYKANKAKFVEKTISEISEMSKLVSATGDKWIYNEHTEKGVILSF